jgi:hypothetical protein
MRADNTLSVRARNRLFLILFHNDPRKPWPEFAEEQKMRFEIDQMLPEDARARLTRLAGNDELSIHRLLILTRQVGRTTANEILRWIGLTDRVDIHACVCRHCGKKMR